MSERPCEKLERTAAVVVGVETYKDQDFHRLDGVADDARKFAEWLVRRGVPANRVLLFLSEDGEPPRCTHDFLHHGIPVKIPVRPATLNDITTAFSAEVSGWGQSAEVGLLIVFWAGHGFINENGCRMLDLADVVAKARVPLNFSSLLEHMEGPPYPMRQAAFIDACAIYTRHVSTSWKTGGLEFPINEKSGDREQFVFHSQRSGLFAPSHPGSDPLSFRGRLLDELERERDDDAFWPPDLLGVASRIKAFFEQKRKAGETDQDPVLDIVGWGGARDRDPLFGARRAGHPGESTFNSDDVASLAGALGSLAFFNEEQNRRIFIRRLPASLQANVRSADRDRFLRALTANILAGPADLGRLLEVFDSFPAIREDNARDDRVFATLDEVKRMAFLWSQVARLRRIVDASQIEPQAIQRTLDSFVGREMRRSGNGAIGESYRHGVGALLLRLAYFSAHDDDRPPLLHLALDLAKSVPRLRENLEAWVRVIEAEWAGDVASEPALPFADRMRYSAESEEETPGPLPQLRLMVDVAPLDFGDDGRFEVRTWLKRGDDDPGVADSPANNHLSVADIAALIDRTLSDQMGIGEVEFFLPTAMLVDGVGRWRVPFGPLGTCPIDARFPVKLRARDRVFGPPDESELGTGMTEAWRARFTKLPGPGSGLAQQHIVRLCCPEDYLDALAGAHAIAGPVCIVGSLAPPNRAAGATSASSRQTLDALLAAGTPIALWPAPAVAEKADSCTVRDRLEALVTGRPPEEIPELVCRLRQYADRVADPLRHLCLLWDDPDRLPPGLDEPLVSLGYA